METYKPTCSKYLWSNEKLSRNLLRKVRAIIRSSTLVMFSQTTKNSCSINAPMLYLSSSRNKLDTSPSKSNANNGCKILKTQNNERFICTLIS